MSLLNINKLPTYLSFSKLHKTGLSLLKKVKRTFKFTLPGGKISSVNLDVAMGTITLVLIPALSPTIRFHLILKSCLGFQSRYQNITLWRSNFWQNNSVKPHKISTHSAHSDNFYFHSFYPLSDWVEILWGFTKFWKNKKKFYS